MKPAVWLVLALAAPSARAAADDIVRSEVDARKVGIDDPLELTITAEGQLQEEVALPALRNLQVAGGPSVSTQFSFVNGVTSQSKTYTYVLQPVMVGKAEVGPVRARMAGGERTAPAISIEVVAGSIRPRERPPRAADPFSEDPFSSFLRGARGPEPKLFVEAVPSRTTLHVGEPLLFTYYLYTQATVTDVKFVEAPQYAGFWAEDLERGNTPPAGEGVTVGGESYRRFPIIQKLLFPTRPGRLTLPASSLKLGIQRQSVFDRGGVVQRSTRPVVVVAEPIPDEPGFSGAVGRFQATATLDRSTLALGEAATLRFRVEGSGNLKWLDRAPEVRLPGARVYPPQVKSEIKAEPGGMRGAKTWEFVVVPQTSGTLEIPSLAFSYFDPQAGRILRAETPALPLRVGGGNAAADAPAPPAAAKEAATSLALRADLDPARQRLPVLSGLSLALIAGVGLLVHAGIWGAARWRERGPGGEGRLAPRRSARAALNALERAGAGGLTKEAAATLIEKTLHDVFGPLEGGEDGERVRAARVILQEVEFVRYAPQLGDYTETIRDLAARAREVVRRWA
ncbi:MAG TPA: BatD family protein [Vicinamibacteria bacterium]|nr:BatD family protein [Vicinamibacteria bacterium]